MLADDNFKFNENGGEFSERVENSVKKGEIARYEQFILFLRSFQQTCTADTKKQGLVWERVNCLQHSPEFKVPQEETFEKTL